MKHVYLGIYEFSVESDSANVPKKIGKGGRGHVKIGDRKYEGQFP